MFGCSSAISVAPVLVLVQPSPPIAWKILTKTSTSADVKDTQRLLKVNWRELQAVANDLGLKHMGEVETVKLLLS